MAVSPPSDDVETSVLEPVDTRGALQRLVEEQAALRRVATLVAQGASPAEVFEAVVTEVGRQVPDANAAALSRYETDDTLTMIGKWSRSDGYVPVGTRYPVVSGTVGSLVAESRQPGRVEVDREGLRSLPEAIRDLGWLSVVGAPIIVDGRLWGLVGISSTTERSLPPDTEERLAEFTELVAAAIANADSRENLAQLVEEQTALRRVATLVAQGARPSEIFAAVSDEVSRLLQAGSAVFRFDDDGRGVIFVGIAPVIADASGAPRTLPIGTRWEFEEGMPTAEVYRTGRSARMEDADWSAGTGPAATIAHEVGLVSSVASPIVVEGRLWGAVSVGSTQRLPPDAESRLEKFTELMATAIANAENRSELAASRKRLVAASDEARRRIERDLHDGTQQRLVSLALAVRAAEAEVPTQSAEVRAKLSGIATGLGEAVEDLQELSRGIHPAVLTEAGLGPALEALALRSPIPVDLAVKTRERFPEPVEVAAYFIASESLANAAKHSQATRITVLLAFENERLRLAMRDDGIGGADPGRGSGLTGLRDRVDALGGTLEIESGPGAGTSLTATLPVGDDQSDRSM